MNAIYNKPERHYINDESRANNGIGEMPRIGG
jgi:hypothetical protein